MTHLTSITDFVLEQKPYRDISGMSRAFLSIEKYAKFLKQPLELWMFVPCVLVGETFANWQPMQEPSKRMWDKFINSELGSFDDSYTYCFEYQKAKEKCLFEGFRAEGKYLWIKNSLFMISDDFNASFNNFGNIERLLNVYLVKDIELTASAQKQLEA